MSSQNTSKRILIVCIILAVLIVLFFFNPYETFWLPKCPFYLLTGLKCPSCGIQRAIYQFLHGNIIEAWKCNAFLVISIPYAVLLIIVTWFDPKNRLERLRKICNHRYTVWSYVAAMVIWVIVRNIFSW